MKLLLVLLLLFQSSNNIIFTYHDKSKLTPKFGVEVPINIYISEPENNNSNFRRIFTKLEAPAEDIFSEFECDCKNKELRTRIYRPFKKVNKVNKSVFDDKVFSEWTNTKKNTLGRTVLEKACN